MPDADPPSPPPQRVQTVVLRAGPPAPRPARWDVATGVAGAVLILAAVAMVWLLPEEDVILPQFQVDVEQVVEDRTSERLTLGEGESVDIPFDVTHDDVFFIKIEVGFADDVPASLPDTFELAVFDHEGNLAADRVTIVNDPGVPKESAAGLEWEPVHREAVLSFDLGLPPEPTFVTGEGPGTDAEEVAADFRERYHLDTTGTWTVRVTMREAGDCPLPGPDVDPVQVAVCRAGAGDEGDPGNPFSIQLFQYTYFEPRVSQL